VVPLQLITPGAFFEFIKVVIIDNSTVRNYALEWERMDLAAEDNFFESQNWPFAKRQSGFFFAIYK
jgi:hypothetical protein